VINLGGIGKAIKRVVSAPFDIVGNVLGFGKTADVSAPNVSAAQVVPSTASTVPESPALGTGNKKKKGKSSLLIGRDNSRSSGSSSYSGLNI
jgi:hypothetical protein